MKNNSIIINSSEEYQNLLAQKDKFLIQYIATWCKKGQDLTEKIEKSLKNSTPNSFFYLVNIDNIEEDLLFESGIKDLPYFAFYNKQEKVDEYSGDNWSMIQDKILLYQEDSMEYVSSHLKPVNYSKLYQQIDELIQNETDFIANCANTASAIWHVLQESRGENSYNWVGFYFVRPFHQENKKIHDLLVLGPFMGKPACKRIPFNKGVCGAAVTSKQIQLVSDVHEFPGHIACDSASNSELVIPIFNKLNQVVALIDIDCPSKNGFNKIDANGLNKIANLLGKQCNWQNLSLPIW